jgi:hypothetical protein
VDRPAAGYAILGGRIAGYGLMAAGAIRQWSDFRDVWNSKNLSEEDWEQLKINGFLFGTGAFVNVLLWGADVLGAYHVSIREKNWVIYHYGLRADGGAADELALLRSYERQDDKRVSQALRYRLWQIRTAPEDFGLDSAGYGEAMRMLAVIEREDERSDRAIAVVLETLAAGSSPVQNELVSLAVDILSSTEQLSWGEDRRILWNAMNAILGEEIGLPGLAALTPLFDDPGLREEFRTIGLRYLAGPSPVSGGDEVLLALAEAWRQDGEVRSAANAAAKVLAFYPESPLSADALARAREDFGNLGDEIALEQLSEYF